MVKEQTKINKTEKISKPKMKDKEFAKYKNFCKKNNLHFCRIESLELFYKSKKTA